MPDPAFVFAQSLSGLTAAMFLFLIASGLSLIFGVLRVLNFAHGTFYMLGAYAAYQFVQWLGVGGGRFWLAGPGAAAVVGVLGGSAAYKFGQWVGVGGWRFWLAALGAAAVVAMLGGLIERLLFRHLYGK